MRDLALDNITHDLLIEDFDLKLLDGIDQVVQNIKIRLLFFYNEWFLDTTKGIKYFDDVFIKNPNIDNIDAIFKATILDTEGVEEIIEFQSTYNNALRNYNIIASIKSSESDEIVNLQFTDIFNIVI